jgi:hypothetical protein
MRYAHAVTVSAHQRKTGWLRRAAVLLLSAVREIFDEAAYERFLTRTKVASSVKAYEAFRKDYDVLKAKGPRCC